ncbi:MAG: response regulator [Deltaproteobacteria bacterium]|nr:MAG: response regulator [Deltaproteobacteria bacterium]
MASKKILLVDDTVTFLELEKTFLKRSGCQIITANSGKEALKKFRSDVPDLVLLDLLMPDMNGDEVCKIIKKDKKLRKIPIVMVSSSGREEDIERCQKLGCEDYLTKPVSQKELLDKVAQILNIPQRRDLRVSVQMKVEGGVGDEAFYGETENISMGGILVRSVVPMKDGAMVELKFLLPGQKYHAEAKGKVVRADGESFKPEYGLGIIFQDLGPNAREMIEDFIRRDG